MFLAAFYILLPIYFISFITTCPLLYCIWKRPKLCSSNHDRISVSVITSCLVWVVLIFPLNCLILANGGLDGARGHLYCQLNGAFITFAASSLMLGQMLMAIERFSLIVLDHHLKVPFRSVYLIFVIFSLSMIGVHLLGDAKFRPLENDLWCFFPLTYQTSIVEIWPSLVMICYFAAFAFAQNFCYSLVLLKSLRVIRANVIIEEIPIPDSNQLEKRITVGIMWFNEEF